MRKDIVVFRCEDCIKDLQEYNPYVYKNKEQIPLEKIEVIKVDKYMCENNEMNMHYNPQLQAPVLLTNASDTPWSIKYWDSIYDREQGVSAMYGEYETFEEARKTIANSSYAPYWAAYEIILNDGENEYPVYTYANCRPLADEFLKINSGSNQSVKRNCKCDIADKTGEREYEVHIHYEGCIHYIVEAKNDEEAKQAALGLFEDENSDNLINRLEHDVCDCELYGQPDV